MFTDTHERWDWLIGLAIAAVVFGGVHWLRSRPGVPPPLAEEAGNVAVFQLAEPLPVAHDGVRDVMMTVHECTDAHGKKVFSEKACKNAAKAAGAGF